MTSQPATPEPTERSTTPQPHAGEQVVVAVHVADSAMSVGLMTLQGALLDRDTTPIDRDLSGPKLYESLDALVQAQLTRGRDHHGVRPVAVGLGCTGPVARGATTVSPAAITAWRDFPLHDKLTTSTRLPVFGELDSKAFALAEGWLGAAAGHDSFIAIVVAAQVSGGIVLNGRLVDGASGSAGHLGHIIVEPNGRRCWCGARGCLDAEASAPAIESITGRSPTQPTYEIMQRTGRLVGRAVATVCNALDVDLAVIGGGVALGFGATFFNSAQETLDAHARLGYSRGARVTPARLGDRGPLVGAGALAVRGLRRARPSAG